MYSDFSNNDVIQNGRKKVYSTKEKLELILPNGEDNGVLEKGDLVYIVQKFKAKGKDAFRFRVMKFMDTKKEGTIYSAEQEFFEPYYEKKQNADATNEEEKKEINYTIPTITALSGGVFGYLAAQKYQKNVIAFGLGGLAIGLAVGIFIIKSNVNKKTDK